ncbi:MAG: NDP-sugar synthase [Candidatus Heimdallarchaeota archaeon]|nr:NDP-sugar synthase [Candidatus Heimdallarchaeota archaeon]
MNDITKVDCAIVLAGGKGTRLRPLTTNLPKPLVPVTLTPMIDFSIKQLTDAGISKIIVAVKYLGEQIKDYLLSSPKFEGLDITIPDIDPIGTADAVRKVSNLIDGDYIVSMADIVCDLSIKQMQKFFYKTDAYATISLKNIDFPTKKFGVILLDKNQNIDIFLEKPKPEEMLFTTMAFAYRPVAEFHQNLVNTGIYCFKNETLEILDSLSDINDFGTDFFPYLLQEKFKLNGFIDEYYWIDCGNIRSYLWSNFDIMRGFVSGFNPPGKNKDGIYQGENCSISPDAKLISPVVLGNNVTIADNTSIGPFVVLHDDVNIAKNSRVERSVIWENSIIDEGATIEKSVICNDMKIEKNRTIINYSAIS